jgi:hypothetical protein
VTLIDSESEMSVSPPTHGGETSENTSLTRSARVAVAAHAAADTSNLSAQHGKELLVARGSVDLARRSGADGTNGHAVDNDVALFERNDPFAPRQLNNLGEVDHAILVRIDIAEVDEDWAVGDLAFSQLDEAVAVGVLGT